MPDSANVSPPDPLEVEQSVLDRAIEYADDMVTGLASDFEAGSTAAVGVDRASQRALGANTRAQLQSWKLINRADLSFGAIIVSDDFSDDQSRKEFRVGLCNIELDEDTHIIDHRSDLGEAFIHGSHHKDPVSGRQVFETRTFERQSCTITSITIEHHGPGKRPAPVKLSLMDATESSVDTGSGVPQRVPTAPAPIRAEPELRRSLESERDGRLRHAAATIQRDQDRLVRADPKTPLVIEGGPGTGKTIVGLHRVAQILYTMTEDMDPVLLVGPGSEYTRFVSEVLPSLGEVGEKPYRIDDIKNLCLRNVGMTIHNRLEPSTTVAVAKGSRQMAELIRLTLWARVGRSAEKITKDGPLRLRLERAHDLSHAEIATLLHKVENAMGDGVVSYADCRTLLEEFLQSLVHQGLPLSRGFSTAELNPQPKEFKIDVSARQPFRSLAASLLPAFRADEIVRTMLTETDPTAGRANAEQSRLLTVIHRPRTAKWTNADVPLLAEAQHILKGSERYHHIVIDEAQNLSGMQWLAIRRRSAGDAITLLGDLNQRTNPAAPTAWPEVLQGLGLQRAASLRLLRSYRVPAEILKVASRALDQTEKQFVPRGFRRGIDPIFRSFPKGLKRRDIEQVLGTRARYSVAVITSRQDLNDLEVESTPQRGMVSVLSPDAAQGLEFDWLIAVEPAEWCDGSAEEYHRLYVALTRATKRVYVLHGRNLPKRLQPARKVKTKDASRR